MLLIGAVGRNSGETEFARRVLRQFADREIIGIKVTAIRRSDGSCPRGGDGCGVCSSLEGRYDITEETDPGSHKDTSRLLAGGARRVFWLRVMKANLEEGVNALFDVTGRDAVSICESNSLRNAVRPGLFLMIMEKGSKERKASALAVMDRADRIVYSDGTDFDIDFQDVRLVDGRWILKEHATAIVLAGGDSTRMSSDKSMLPVAGKPMIQHVYDQLQDHFDQMLISANDPEKYAFLDAAVAPDRVPGQGPLMGIASALAISDNELNLVVACDVPDIDVTLAHRMLDLAKDHEIVVPRVDRQHFEPLFAVYRKSVAAKMNEMLSAGERRIRALFDECRTRYVDLPASVYPRNLNTMREYEAYVAEENVRV